MPCAVEVEKQPRAKVGAGTEGHQKLGGPKKRLWITFIISIQTGCRSSTRPCSGHRSELSETADLPREGWSGVPWGQLSPSFAPRVLV